MGTRRVIFIFCKKLIYWAGASRKFLDVISPENVSYWPCISFSKIPRDSCVPHLKRWRVDLPWTWSEQWGACRAKVKWGQGTPVSCSSPPRRLQLSISALQSTRNHFTEDPSCANGTRTYHKEWKSKQSAFSKDHMVAGQHLRLPVCVGRWWQS